MSESVTGIEGTVTGESATEIMADELPRVYVDCHGCDYNYLRQEIPFVSYVRDPDLAQVHVFVRGQRTAGGGTEYALTFTGTGAFSDINNRFSHVSDRDDTSAERREGLTSAIKLGLTAYAARTPVARNLSLSFDDNGNPVNSDNGADPWDHWVFNAYAGGMQLSMESNRTRFDSRWGFSADRVTRDWKIGLRPYFNYNVDIIAQEEGDEIRSTRERHGFNGHVVKSLTEHWSAGMFANYLTRTDRNLNHQVRLSPGIEYTIFPYDQAATHAITFTYSIGYAWNDYFQPTIYDQMQEHLLTQRLEAAARVRQPWGDVQAGLLGSHYFHDIAYRRAELYAQVSVRLTRGLSLNVSGDVEVINDQLSLPRGDASLEDILLRQRELATSFYVRGSVGLSYTFGSRFANVVNTRM